MFTTITIRYILPSHHGHTSQDHGHVWITHILFIPCQSAVPALRLGYFKFLPWHSKSRSWVWSKGKVMQLAQYPFNALSFDFTPIPIRPTIPEIQLFRNLTLKHPKVRVMSEVKGQGHISYLVINRCFSCSFHINRTNHSWDFAKKVFELEKTYPNFLKKIR